MRLSRRNKDAAPAKRRGEDLTEWALLPLLLLLLFIVWVMDQESKKKNGEHL